MDIFCGKDTGVIHCEVIERHILYEHSSITKHQNVLLLQTLPHCQLTLLTVKNPVRVLQIVLNSAHRLLITP